MFMHCQLESHNSVKLIMLKMGSAKDQRKYWLMLWLFVCKVCLPTSVQVVATSGNESRIVERVSRRQTADIYFFINSTTTIICRTDKNNTYLISEDQCVKDQELYRGNLIRSYH